MSPLPYDSSSARSCLHSSNPQHGRLMFSPVPYMGLGRMHRSTRTVPGRRVSSVARKANLKNCSDPPARLGHTMLPYSIMKYEFDWLLHLLLDCYRIGYDTDKYLASEAALSPVTVHAKVALTLQNPSRVLKLNSKHSMTP